MPGPEECELENLVLSLNAVLPMFLTLAAGYISQKAGILTREDVQCFNRVEFVKSLILNS